MPISARQIQALLTPLFVLFISAALFACGAEDPPGDGGGGAQAHTSLAYPVDQPGLYQVGYRSWEHTYEGLGGLGSRTIRLHMWYPTTEPKGEHPTYGNVWEDKLSFIDAPLAAPDDPAGYPVHVYTHGHQGFAGTSNFLMRAFASHGWIAIAPDHVGNMLIDFVPPKQSWLFYTRSTDVSAALDALETLPESDPLHGLARTDKVVMSGHSFGVHTCWAVAGAKYDVAAIEAGCKNTSSPMPSGECTQAQIDVYAAGSRDPRVVASVAMAGSIDRKMFGAEGHKAVDIPMMTISGGKDPVGADAQYDSADGVDITWIDIAGGCHQSFALGPCGTLAPEVAFPIIETYARALARRHVLGDEAPQTLDILSGKTQLSDLVSFQRKGQK